MSLVAYGSSDDSDQSDSEQVSTHETATTIVPNSFSDSAPRHLEEKFSDSDSENLTDTAANNSDNAALDHKLKELPAPKPGTSTVPQETDVLEEEVKPKPSQVADIVKPAPRKSRQPVKIKIPALPDSDDENEGPAAKRPRPGANSQGKSGLTSLLPAPVHAAKKEMGRILLPHSLTKKSQPSVATNTTKNSTTVSSNKKTITSLAADYSSDSEDEAGEPVSFFSLDSSAGRNANSRLESLSDSSNELKANKFNKNSADSTNDDVPTVSLPPQGLRTSLHLPAPHVTEEKSMLNSDTSFSNNAPEGPVVGPSMPPGPVMPSGGMVDPDAPLTFKGGVTSQRRYTNSSVSSSSDVMGAGQNMYYNMPYDSGVQYPESTDIEGFKQDQEFLRLQGKKLQGKEEINLIDVNADDYTDPSELTKHLTEEETYQSHRKKDNQPTGQQKRKHQIHYLAFQAKERELELKNQWSQNRMTKKQTQAKYGF